MKTYFLPSARNSMQFDIKQWQSIFFFILIFICLYRPIILQAGITSNLLYHKADSIASTIVNKPYFLEIKSEDVDTNGKAIYWNYAFMGHDTKNDYTYIYVHLAIDSLSYEFQTSSSPMSGWEPMDMGWIDSDSALAIAEANGGRQFRSKYGDIQIIADLCKPSGSPYNIWDIWYCSIILEKIFCIDIDALEKIVLYSWETAVVSHETEDSYNLFQNYPNPFNASTVIPFGMDKPGFVTLKIYDVNGRVVDILFESFCSSGNYKINWTPKTLPSGIYFYRLKSDKTVFTKKLVYLR